MCDSFRDKCGKKCANFLFNFHNFQLSTQLSQIKKDLKTESETMSYQNGVPLMMVMRQGDDYESNYTQPAKPAVKILRRPTPQSSEIKSSENRPKQPIKTLQQREQEYAEARLRILGSAKNPEDELEAPSLPKVVTKVAEECAEEGNLWQPPRMPGEVFPSSFILNGQIRPQDNILRMPRGPDGTSGFNFRR